MSGTHPCLPMIARGHKTCTMLLRMEFMQSTVPVVVETSLVVGPMSPLILKLLKSKGKPLYGGHQSTPSIFPHTVMASWWYMWHRSDCGCTQGPQPLLFFHLGFCSAKWPRAPSGRCRGAWTWEASIAKLDGSEMVPVS